MWIPVLAPRPSLILKPLGFADAGALLGKLLVGAAWALL